MRRLLDVVSLVGMIAIACVLATSVAFAYEEGEAGKAVIQGIITFKGTPPPPILIPIGRIALPAYKYCSRFYHDGKGNRIIRGVTVNKGRLQDVVVSIRNITKGKPFLFTGTDVIVRGCEFLVQGGPSTFVGVVVKKAELRVLNNDADPSDPRAATGVLHHPHAYEVSGDRNTTIFSLVLIEKGDVLTKPVILRKKDSVFLLENDSPHLSKAWFLPVDNPYYAIVGSAGTYEIDRVPPGTYQMIAWHPLLGIQEQEIDVGATGTVTADFEFAH